MPEPTELEEWAVGNYGVVIDPDTSLPTTWSGQPRRNPAARAAQAALGFEADEPSESEAVNDWINNARLWIQWARDEVGRDRFGDGSDGDVTLGAGTTTLARAMYYDNLTLGATSVLDTNGWPIYVRGVLTSPVGAVIHADGAAAVGTTAGANGGSRMLGRGADGASTAGFAGGDALNAIGGIEAGAGGDEGGGGTAGGVGGYRTDPQADQGGLQVFAQLERALTFRNTEGDLVDGGPGGGAGGGAARGTGGAGGNVLAVIAHELAYQGTFRARGGAGSAATAGNGGGGGGGAGGFFLLITRRGDLSVAPRLPPVTGTWDMTDDVTGLVSVIDLLGGTGGADFGTGVTGLPGAAGNYQILRG